MNKSPVSLLDYFPKQLEIRPNLDYEARESESYQPIDAGGVVSEIEFGLAHRASSPEEQVYGVRLTIKSAPGEKGLPYQFLIALEGFVDIDKSQEPDQGTRDQLAAVNGPAVLYSAAREMLLSLTYRFPKGPLLLPTVNFFGGRDGFAALRREMAERSASKKTSSPRGGAKRAKKRAAQSADR